MMSMRSFLSDDMYDVPTTMRGKDRDNCWDKQNDSEKPDAGALGEWTEGWSLQESRNQGLREGGTPGSASFPLPWNSSNL
jgi:hypothetical protein